MIFELTEKEQEALAKYKAKILKNRKKKLERISFTIMFTPTGIGDVVQVKNSETDEVKDITDYDLW
jgi:hypothetical protein